MTTEAPRRAALDTTEILENVLSFLPNRKIFIIQRVCRRWRDVIAGSPDIQQKLFLQLRGQASEIWVSTNRRVSLDNPNASNFDIRSVEKKLRTISPTELQSELNAQAWGPVNRTELQLFTPVTLNPLLRCPALVRRHVEEDNFEDSAVFSTREDLAHLANNGSVIRSMFITDPPCREVELTLIYNARPCRPRLYVVGCCARVDFDKPLRIGDVIDEPLALKQAWIQEKSKSAFTEFREDITAAEKIAELEEQHNCRLVLSDVRFMLTLEDRCVRPLPLTYAEYLRYKPKE